MITMLPCELVCIIYECLNRHRDVINLSLVCKLLYNTIPNEILRVFNILRSYYSVNAEIKNIEYGIINQLDTCKSFLMYGNRRAIYVWHAWQYDINGVGRVIFIAYNTHSQICIISDNKVNIVYAEYMMPRSIEEFMLTFDN